MDGMAQFSLVGTTAPSLSRSVPTQRTIKAPIGCVGVGLHSGNPVTVTLRPAPAGAGVVFHRTDLGVSIPAVFGNVADTRLCTVIAHPMQEAARVGTIEHLMAALQGLGISNVIVEVDGPELPVLDGSSSNWVFLLDCAGITCLNTPARVIQVLRTVRVEEGEAFAELHPHTHKGQHGLELALSIDFDAAAIGRQSLSLTLTEDSFRASLADSRTFALAQEIAGLRAAGLAQGGSLDNAVVVDGAAVLNPTGLRRPDEFVRHKLLDAVGDLALAGGMLQGRFVGRCSGHALNNRLLRAMFADQANWRERPSALAGLEPVSVAA